MGKWIFVAIVCMVSFLLGFVSQAAEVSPEQIRGLDEQVQEVKGDVLAIAAELSRLEEKLLFPADTQVAVFVSLASGEPFRLDAIALQLGGKPVASHLYTFKELEALQKGGVQRLYTGNLTSGGHDLQVTVSGKTAGGAEVRRTENFQVHKEVGPKVVELTVAGEGVTLKDR